jgi:hypothetical protein
MNPLLMRSVRSRPGETDRPLEHHKEDQMADALIGHTGFIGSTLLRQTPFDALYRSTDIGGIDGRSFETVVCAGAPAQKWIANREPAADRGKIECLISHLCTINCQIFILVSTVDVFKRPIGVDEDSPVDEVDLHPYGLNRRLLEKFVIQHFEGHLVLRLPGLVGPGLRKNIIFDFLHGNNTGSIDSRGVFQFYPMVNLWPDIKCALRAGLRVVHLTAEPVSVSEISELGFGRPFIQELNGAPAYYDLKTKHAKAFYSAGSYQYSKRETIMAVRAYAQSEADCERGRAVL